MKHLRSINEEVEQDDWYVLPTNTTIDTLERILMEAWQFVRQ